MESADVRMARVEERMVAFAGDMREVKGTVSKIWDKLSQEKEARHELSGKVLGVVGGCSVLTTIVTVVLVKLIGH